MPSKSRGLRTSTGCLTCRKRRVKCDETRPSCKTCDRVKRECFYAEKETTPRPPRRLSVRKTSDVSTATESTSSNAEHGTSLTLPTDGIVEELVQPPQPWIPFPVDQTADLTNVITDDNFFLDDSLFTFGDTLTPNFGPLEWYDLLAEDAITNMQGQTHSSRWNFDINSLSRRQTPRPSPGPDIGTITFDNAGAQAANGFPVSIQPWNTDNRIELKPQELIYFQHYVDIVAPILDLFDPARHFASAVPHLALRNVGLLRCLLAVGACHMALYQPQDQVDGNTPRMPPDTPASTFSAAPSTTRVAEQFYYETLQYMSQNLLYQDYTTSPEILATAILIGTYEMFLVGIAGRSDHSNWDRHLRGAFWIQRNSNTSGESEDGLSRAVWWAWLRQDVWAAFRTGRPALTIHQMKVPMSELTPDGLATRVIYIAAKCVQFAATPKEGDIAGYIEAGETLMRMLDAWKRILPPAFEPIPIVATAPSPASASDTTHIAPIWIHPPAYAAAIQTYHFAKIIMILNQPSTGGLNMYQTRFKLLRESTTTICGIAMASQSQNLPSSFVSFQAIYAAALCAETQERQKDILEIMEKILDISKYPSKSILDDLISVWGNTS